MTAAGICSGCKTHKHVRGDGLIRGHRIQVVGLHGPCPGSFKPPVDVGASVVERAVDAVLVEREARLAAERGQPRADDGRWAQLAEEAAADHERALAASQVATSVVTGWRIARRVLAGGTR